MPDLAKVFRDALAAFHGKDLVRAERLFSRVLKVDPANVAALNLITIVLMTMERFAEAERHVEKATSLNPNSDVSFYNYGLICKRLNKPKRALEQFNKALALNSSVAETWNSRGAVYNELGEHKLAVGDFDRAISLNPAFAEAHSNRGNALLMLKRRPDAIVAYDRALSLRPQLAGAWFGRGNALYDLNRYDEAFEAYDKAFRIEPELEDVEGVRLHTKMRLCNWDRLEEEVAHLTATIRAGRGSCGPFALLSLSNSSGDHFRCAEAWVARKCMPSPKPLWRRGDVVHGKIRLGYVSTDFRMHATAHLIAELIELHDKKRFEVFGYSIGKDDQSNMRTRLTNAFDSFIDCEAQADSEIARTIAETEIDILEHFHNWWNRRIPSAVAP
ncbi:tetratricopeptide repeat protein [Bradyrhizobium genosp. P]|uniref:tetratricopeptide repeat protein n=1 Tax=Bradyrhizobium genosp. P TaxID=83641 RepID=UPI003CF49DC4